MLRTTEEPLGCDLPGPDNSVQDELAQPRNVLVYVWNMPLVLQYIDQFPDEWHKPPRVHRLLRDRMVRTLTSAIELKAVDFQWEYVVEPWQRAVVLKTLDGRVVQRLKELDKAQHDLKHALAGRPCSPGYLYDKMIRSAERSNGYDD